MYKKDILQGKGTVSLPISLIQRPNGNATTLNPELQPSVHLVGHRITVQTQRTRRLIRVSTVCLQNNLLKFDPNGCKTIPLNKNENTTKHSKFQAYTHLD